MNVAVLHWVLVCHYGFTAEELDFILNYDINPESFRGQIPPRPRHGNGGGLIHTLHKCCG